MAYGNYATFQPFKPTMPGAPPAAPPSLPAAPAAPPTSTPVLNQAPPTAPTPPPAPRMPTPVTPPGTPPAPPAPAAPTGTAEQQATARQPAGTYPDDSPDAGNANTGDSYLDELRSGNVATAEDWRRFSNAQLKAWQPFYIGNGQFKNKYGDIVGKPPDRGPNTPAGVNGMGEKGGFGQAPAGGGGGGFGGLFGGGGGKGGKGGGGLESSEIWKAIQARLKGGTRYTPEAMAGFLSEVKGTAEAQAGQQKEEALAQAAASGMARAPATSRLLAGIRANTYGQTLQAKNQLAKAKIDADYEDKTSAIQQGLEWLNSLRSYVSSMTATEAQKAAAMANIDLGYARMNQEQDMMRERYAQQLAAMGLG